MDDEEFLAEASSLLGTESELSALDLKDALRERGFFGNWDCRENILSFLRAEHYSTQLAQRKQDSEDGLVFKRLFSAIGSGTPPANVSQRDFFMGIDAKVKSCVMREVNERNIAKFLGGAPLVSAEVMSPIVAEATQRLIDHLNQEYRNRMMVLLKRLDVTIQSFNWSQRAKQNQDKIIAAYQKNRAQLDRLMETGAYAIQFEDLMIARENLLWDSKTSHGEKRASTKLNKVLMHSNVPDRGGRANEQHFEKETFQKQEDARNMPKFQPRQGQAHNPKDFQGGGRGGGGPRGGRGRNGVGGRGGYNNDRSGGYNNDRRQDDRSPQRGGSGRGRGRGRGQNPNVNYGDRGFQGRNF